MIPLPRGVQHLGRFIRSVVGRHLTMAKQGRPSSSPSRRRPAEPTKDANRDNGKATAGERSACERRPHRPCRRHRHSCRRRRQKKSHQWSPPCGCICCPSRARCCRRRDWLYFRHNHRRRRRWCRALLLVGATKRSSRAHPAMRSTHSLALLAAFLAPRACSPGMAARASRARRDLWLHNAGRPRARSARRASMPTFLASRAARRALPEPSRRQLERPRAHRASPAHDPTRRPRAARSARSVSSPRVHERPRAPRAPRARSATRPVSRRARPARAERTARARAPPHASCARRQVPRVRGCEHVRRMPEWLCERRARQHVLPAVPGGHVCLVERRAAVQAVRRWNLQRRHRRRNCTRCAAGTVASTGASSCTSCAPGTQASVATCHKCAVGKYSDSYGSECRRCRVGTIAPAEGLHSCEKRPKDMTSSSGGSMCVPEKKVQPARACRCAATAGRAAAPQEPKGRFREESAASARRWRTRPPRRRGGERDRREAGRRRPQRRTRRRRQQQRQAVRWRAQPRRWPTPRRRR